MPEGIPSPEGGTLSFEAVMKLDQVLDVGRTQFGQRQAIVVRDGAVSGSKLTGSVLPGALDFQLKLSNGVIEIEQLLVLKTSDGEIIIVRNAGPYGGLVPTFEVRTQSPYAWLNKGSYLSSNPAVGAGGVSITMTESTN